MPLFGVLWVLNHTLNTQILRFLPNEISPAREAPWGYFRNFNLTYPFIEISPARQGTFSYATHPIIEISPVIKQVTLSYATYPTANPFFSAGHTQFVRCLLQSRLHITHSYATYPIANPFF